MKFAGVMERLVWACALFTLCAHAVQILSPPLQSEAEVALLDGRVDAASVDHEFRRAFNKAISSAESKYGSMLLANTFDKINQEGTKDLKRRIHKEFQDNIHKAMKDQTEGVNRMLDETDGAIKEMSRRAHALHAGVMKLQKDMDYDMAEESHKAVMKHKLKEEEREAEIELNAPLSSSQKAAKALSGAQDEAQELQGDEEHLQKVFQLKCQHMVKENKRRTSHIKGQISELKISMKAAAKAFKTSSEAVDQAISQYSVHRKDSRMAAHALDKALYLKRSPFKKTGHEPTKKKGSEDAAQVSEDSQQNTKNTKLEKVLSEDSLEAARSIAAKAAKQLHASQFSVHEALNKLKKEKKNVVDVQMSMKQHEALSKRLKDQMTTIESLCQDPLKPEVKKDTEFEQAVSEAKNLTGKHNNTNITKLLEDTKSFAAESMKAAQKLKQSVLKTKSALPSATPVVRGATGLQAVQEEELQEEQEPQPEVVPTSTPSTQAQHKESENTKSDAFAGNVAVTPDMCKVARLGMKALCKQHGERSSACVSAQKKYDSQC